MTFLLHKFRFLLTGVLMAMALPWQAVLASDDECIPSPEDGIFCGDNTGGIHTLKVGYKFYGDSSMDWVDHGFRDPETASGTYHIISLFGGATLNVYARGYFQGAIEGDGGIRLTGGTVHITGNGVRLGASDFISEYSYTGGFDIAGGTVSADNEGVFGTGPLTLSGGQLNTDYRYQGTSIRGFLVTGEGSRIKNDSLLSIRSEITGSGSFAKAGAGNLRLTQENSFTGELIAEQGNVVIEHENALAQATFTANGGTAIFGSEITVLTFGAFSGASDIALSNSEGQSVTLTVGGEDKSTSYSGAFTGSGGFIKEGSGAFSLSGASSHSGNTIVRGGILKTDAAGALSEASAVFLNGGATIDLNGHDQTVGDLDSYNSRSGQFESGVLKLGGATLTNLNRVTNIWAGSIEGTGEVVKKGAASMNWYAANTFTGRLAAEEGTIKAMAVDVFSPNAAIKVLSGAAVNLNNFDQTIAGLEGEGTVLMGSASLKIASVGSHTFSGQISGEGSLTQDGDGSQTLNASNTYSGGTYVWRGSLVAGHAGAFGTGAVEVDGGTLNLAGYGIGNTIILKSGTLSGATNYSGTHKVSGLANYSGTIGGNVDVESGGAVNTTGATFSGTVMVKSGAAVRGTGDVADLIVKSGGVLAPGNSPGMLSAGTAAWAGGSVFEWELADASAAAGIGYDTVSVSGVLTLSATDADPFTIRVLTLGADLQAGQAAGLEEPFARYVFTLASVAGGIEGFDPMAFFVDTTGFLNEFDPRSSWSVELDGTNLNLVYTAVPEPGAVFLVAAGLLAVVVFRRGVRKDKSA